MKLSWYRILLYIWMRLVWKPQEKQMTDWKGDLVSNQTFSFFISATAAATSIQSLAHLLYPSLGVVSQNWYGLLIFPHGNQHLLQLHNNIYEDEDRLVYISLLSFILLHNQKYKKWYKRISNHILFFRLFYSLRWCEMNPFIFIPYFFLKFVLKENLSIYNYIKTIYLVIPNQNLEYY